MIRDEVKLMYDSQVYNLVALGTPTTIEKNETEGRKLVRAIKFAFEVPKGSCQIMIEVKSISVNKRTNRKFVRLISKES
jgi:hypothetical protein